VLKMLHLKSTIFTNPNILMQYYFADTGDSRGPGRRFVYAKGRLWEISGLLALIKRCGD
jgi:hypothetical protein